MSDELDALRKVEDVSECIKKLATSNNPETLDAADKLLKKIEGGAEDLKTKTDRTLINKDLSNGAVPGAANPDAFMQEIERDAAERAERRQRNRRRAAEWKERGNAQFKLANYDQAVDCYTKGLAIAKDFEVLYQNRANCYVKQGRFEEALADAEAAIFLTGEKCAKPFFHKAKALTGLNRLPEARAAYTSMAACPDAAPGHAERCLADLNRLASAREDEARALAEFNSGSAGSANSVEMLIYRLARGDRPLAYYSAGMRCLAALLVSANERVLFRAKNGFSLLTKQQAVVQALAASLDSMTDAQLDLLTASLMLATAVANGDAENCHQLAQLSQPGQLLARAFDVIVSAASAVSPARQAALEALSTIGQLACDRLCGACAEPAALVAALLRHTQRQAAHTALASARLLQQRLADCARLRQRLDRAAPPALTGLVQAGESLLTAGATESLAAFCLAVESLRRLMAACRPVRQAAAARRAFLTACCAALERYAPDREEDAAAGGELQQSAAVEVAGLLASACLEATPAVSDAAPKLGELALRVADRPSAAPELREFCLAVLASLAPRSGELLRQLDGADSARLLGLLGRVLASPGHPCAASALRILAALLAVQTDVRGQVGDDPHWLELLLELLHSRTDCLLGNAALCLGRCVEDTAAAELLARTDVVRLLLCRMRDCRDRDAKANCAILCGKLAQAHHGHRERLAQLDGINILNSVLTTNNIRL